MDEFESFIIYSRFGNLHKTSWSIVFIPYCISNKSGTYSITIRAIDGAGLYADHTFTITVKPASGYIAEKDTIGWR